MRTNEYMSLGDAIDLYFKESGLRIDVQIQKIIVDWVNIVGKPIANNTERIWFDRGILYVKVTSSVWRQELSMVRTHLKDAVNKYLNEALIEEIKIV